MKVKTDNNNFIIKKCSYFIEIVRKFDGRVERIKSRIASRYIDCCECDNGILKGDVYIRDEFWNTNFYSKGKLVKYRSNFICLKCWRGELPKKVSKNK